MQCRTRRLTAHRYDLAIRHFAIPHGRLSGAGFVDAAGGYTPHAGIVVLKVLLGMRVRRSANDSGSIRCFHRGDIVG